MNGNLQNKSLVEVIGQIVQSTSNRVLPGVLTKTNDNMIGPGLLANDINYQYGTWKQIAETLTLWGSDPVLQKQKYPLIAMESETPTIKQGGNQFCTVTIPQIVIAINVADLNTNAFQQQTNYYNYILYPILDEFIYQISRSRYFVVQSPLRDIKYQKRDRRFDSLSNTDGKNRSKLPDYLVAIEITNLVLTGKNEIN